MKFLQIVAMATVAIAAPAAPVDERAILPSTGGANIVSTASNLVSSTLGSITSGGTNPSTGGNVISSTLGSIASGLTGGLANPSTGGSNALTSALGSLGTGVLPSTGTGGIATTGLKQMISQLQLDLSGSSGSTAAIGQIVSNNQAMVTAVAGLVQKNIQDNTAILKALAPTFQTTLASIVNTIATGATKITKDEIALLGKALGQLQDSLKSLQATTTGLVGVLKPALEAAVTAEVALLKSTLTQFVQPLQSLVATIMLAGNLQGTLGDITLDSITPLLQTIIKAI